MTRPASRFRPQFLVMVSWISASCGGAGPAPAEPPPEVSPGSGGSPAPAGVGGSGGSPVIDAGGTFLVDRAIERPRDTEPEDPDDPDGSATDVVAPPSEPGLIVATTCEQIPCQGLFAAAAACSGDGVACQSQTVAQGEIARTNYCHVNGVKKLSTSSSTPTGYLTSMRVLRPNGTPCYTLDLTGSDTSDQEMLVWKSPSGFVLLSGTWSKSAGRLILSCGPSRYEPRDLGCPGLEGEPGVEDCPPGVCPD